MGNKSQIMAVIMAGVVILVIGFLLGELFGIKEHERISVREGHAAYTSDQFGSPVFQWNTNGCHRVEGEKPSE